MKAIIKLLCCLLCCHLSLAAQSQEAYYNLEQIRAAFPTSLVKESSQEDFIEIENKLQGYTLFFFHYQQMEEAQAMFHSTLAEAAKQGLLIFYSNTGYTTLLDAKLGLVYGLFVDGQDFVSLRFANIDSIPLVLEQIREKREAWRNKKKSLDKGINKQYTL